MIQFDGKKVPRKDLSGALEDEKKMKESPQTVIMEANGMIITQSEEVQGCLDAEIIGESELTAGRKFIITYVEEEGEDSKVVLLSFAQDGKAEIVSVF